MKTNKKINRVTQPQPVPAPVNEPKPVSQTPAPSMLQTVPIAQATQTLAPATFEQRPEPRTTATLSSRIGKPTPSSRGIEPPEASLALPCQAPPPATTLEPRRAGQPTGVSREDRNASSANNT